MLAISRWFKTDTWLSLSAVAFLGISTLSGAHYAGDPDCQAPCPDKCRLVGDLPVVENEGSICVDAVSEYGRKEDGCCDSAVGATNPVGLASHEFACIFVALSAVSACKRLKVRQRQPRIFVLARLHRPWSKAVISC